jgi:acyl carrier protein
LLARHAGDGRLEILGDSSRRVRHRGYWVDLVDIEHCLVEHEGIKAACVLDVAGRRTEELVAFVVAGSSVALDSPQLRQYIAAALPGFMVPDRFIRIDALPLDEYGAVERAALLHLATSDDAHQQGEPQGDLEIVLAALWCDVLGVEDLQRNSNFFELGGDSIRATRITARVHSTLTVKVPVSLVYTCPTVAEYAAALSADPATRRRAWRAAELLVGMQSQEETELG